jgi:hypothetical protein
MRSVRVFLVTLLGAVLLAGCGGSETGSSTDSAATAPSNAGFYVSVDTNRDGDQWRKLEALVDEIPGGQEALDSFLGAFAKDAGVDIEEDVLPAVGGEVVLVLPAGSANPVVLVQPENREKLEQLAAKSDEDLVLREVEGWTAIGETDAALDTYEQALEAGRLADDAAFSEAMAELPAETLVRAYVRGEGLEGVLGRAQAGALGSLGALGGLGGLAQGGSASAAALGTIALAVAAEDGGVRISGSADQEGIPPSFAPKLLPKVPHGAFVAVTFKGGKALSEQLRKTVAGSEAELRQLEQLLGITLDDLLELFEGEAVFYARPGLPIPELTLAVESTGGQLKTIDALFQRLAARSNAKITSTVESGVPVKILAVQGISVRYAETAGLVVVTTSPAGIRALAAGGAKLVDDNGFKAAARDVGYDGSTTGFVYVDVDALAPLLQGFLGLAGGGGTPGAAAGLEQLARAIEAFDSVAANVTSRGNRAQFEAFVRIR